MKKQIRIIGIVFSVALLVLLVKLGGNQLNFSDCMVKEGDYSAIVSSRNNSSELFQGLSFDGEKLFYDKTNGYFLYSIPEDKDSNPNPTVQITSPKERLQICFLCDRISDDIISQNKGIPFLVYDDVYYQEGVLKCTTLPIMAINTEESIPESKGMPVSMHMQLYDNRFDAVDNYLTSDGSIRVRGNTTLGYPKKSYKLSLFQKSTKAGNKNRKLSLLGMPSDDDWILMAMYEDSEKIRDVFSANLWKESLAKDNSLGVDLGTEFKFVELFINDEYSGLYALGYKLRNEQLGIKKNDKNAALFFKRDYAHFDAMYVDQNGLPYGYELESGQDTEMFSLLLEPMIITAKTHGDEASFYSMIDIDNLAGYYLFLNLIQGVDNIDNNQYILVKHDDNNGLKILYSVWDMNYSWGNAYGTNYGYEPEKMVLYDYGFIQQLINSNPDRFKQAIKDKYLSLRSGAWSDSSLSKMVDHYESDVFESGAYYRDIERWGTVDGDYVQNLSRFRNFIKDRLAAMDRYIDDPELPVSDDCTEFSFGSREPYEAAKLLYLFDSDIRILQVRDKKLWDYSYYLDIMQNLNIPEDFTITEISLRDQLCRFGDTSDFWLLPEDTDLIVYYDGEILSFSNFFTDQYEIDLSHGNLSYQIDENGNGTLMFNNQAILSDVLSEENFSLRYIEIDPFANKIREIRNW